MFIALVFGFHISQVKNKNLLDHISACNSLLRHNKNISFLKQIMMGSEKWILYNNAEQKRPWGKHDEPPPNTKSQSSSRDSDGGIGMLMVGLERSPLLELFPES